jgi:hypothetical protein
MSFACPWSVSGLCFGPRSSASLKGGVTFAGRSGADSNGVPSYLLKKQAAEGSETRARCTVQNQYYSMREWESVTNWHGLMRLLTLPVTAPPRPT